MATVDATEGFAHELHNAVDLGLDVSEADVGERVAVLVDINGTYGEKGRVSIPLYMPDCRVLLSQHPCRDFSHSKPHQLPWISGIVPTQ